MKTKSNLKAGKISFGMVLSVLVFIATGCTTTRFTRLNTSKSLSDNGYHIFEDSFTFSNIEELKNQRFIFLRLYNPVYKRAFSSGSILQAGINIVEVNDINASHASIGFSLKDDFYGLTLFSRPQFKVEHCMEPRKNEYMRQCKITKSIQTVLGLKVTEEEYQNVLDMVSDFLINQNVVYDVSKNFQMALYTTGRKVNSMMTGKKSKPCPYAEGAEIAPHKIEELDLNKQYKFVCSTLISYILYNCVNSYRNYIDLNGLEWNNIGPSDFINFSEFKVMFSSTWIKYNRAAEKYLDSKQALKDFMD